MQYNKRVDDETDHEIVRGIKNLSIEENDSINGSDSGDDTDDDDDEEDHDEATSINHDCGVTKVTSNRKHKKNLTWGGEGALTDGMFGRSSDAGKPPLPPPPPSTPILQPLTLRKNKSAGETTTTTTAGRRNSAPVNEKTSTTTTTVTKFHEKNQKFLLQEAERNKFRALKMQQQLNRGSPSQRLIIMCSPNGVFRKNLAAIVEDGQNSVYSKDTLSYSSIPIHARSGSDECSVLTMSIDGCSWVSDRTEKIAKFKAEQEAMFEQRKQNIRTKLSKLLEKDGNTSDRDKNEIVSMYLQELEMERVNLIRQWQEELEMEEEFFAKQIKEELDIEEELLRFNDPRRRVLRDIYEVFIAPCVESIMNWFAVAEVFICNMPITISAVGLAWVAMGVVWFQFIEELLDSCRPVHYFSPQCTYAEFPGCFECDKSNGVYRAAMRFHDICSLVAGVCCTLFILKVILAWRVVIDELSHPTTSTPCGVFCMAMVCVFAGRGLFGELVVISAAILHSLLAIWFLYMAIVQYKLWPDPGWFPNTIGICYAAVKLWLYFPSVGDLLMWVGVAFFIGVFFISIIRVAMNPKIAAPICWIQLSGPSIVLFAMSLVTQPSRRGEELLNMSPDAQVIYYQFMQKYYVPSGHIMMSLCLVGLVSALHSLWARWDQFTVRPFSPAHVAFVFPILSHANAIHSYRRAIIAFSSFPVGGLFTRLLFIYWCFFLVAGTVLNIIFTFKFVKRLGEWTKGDVGTEDEPPSPIDTVIHEMLKNRTGVHDYMVDQPFVSPAVLEANEAGSLIRLRRGTEGFRIHGPYIRSRTVRAYGFNPTMNDNELRQEHAQLLDWVAKNAPKKRNRTLSLGIPLFGERRVDSFNVAHDPYGTFGNDDDAEANRQHSRSKTAL